VFRRNSGRERVLFIGSESVRDLADEDVQDHLEIPCVIVGGLDPRAADIGARLTTTVAEQRISLIVVSAEALDSDDVLAALAESLPAPAILELRRMAIRSMALDAAPRDRAAARADIEAAAEFLAAAREALPADGRELAEAHLAVALLSIRYSTLPAFEEAARGIVRENAATCARRAESAFAALGVARGRALALDVLGQVAMAEGRRPEAAELLERARESFGTSMGTSTRVPTTVLEVAPIERRLAIAWFELGRKAEALALARDSARRAREASPFGSDAELEARRLVVAMTPPDDAVAAGAERVEIGRVLVQLGRPAAAIEPLSEALRRFADDQTRFRERLEAAVWIARAMDALGSTEAALRTLEQPRVVADAAIFGTETLLARDHAALRQSLRAKIAAQGAGR